MRIERIVKANVDTMFDDIRALFLANVRNEENSDEALETFLKMLNLLLLANNVSQIVGRRLRQDVIFVYLLGYDEGKSLTDLTKDLDLNNPQTLAQIEQIMQKQMIVAETTQRELYEFLSENKDSFTSIKEARKKIDEFIEDEKKARSQTIAQTLVSQSFEAAKLYAFLQANVNEKMWMSVLDERVRHTHLEAHGQTVPILNAFQVGNSALLYPGDPNGELEEIINCRCTILPV